MKNQKGISLIALIITIIVIIILAAIVIVRAMGTVDSANKAKFDQEFSDFSNAVVSKGLDLYAHIISQGYTTDSADYYFMAARNKSVANMIDSTSGQFRHLLETGTAGRNTYDISDGDTTEDTNGTTICELGAFKDIVYNSTTYTFPTAAKLGATDVNGDTKIYCYRIDSSKLDGYNNPAKPTFHGKIGTNSAAAGEPDTSESHWITENGVVFTYPGYFYDNNLYLTNTVTYGA